METGIPGFLFERIDENDEQHNERVTQFASMDLGEMRQEGQQEWIVGFNSNGNLL